MTATGSDYRPPVIEIVDLTREFGLKAALANIELSVPRGLVFGLVGPNGAGKTTLIKHVLGLLKPTTGSVRVFGYDPTKDPVSVSCRHRLPLGRQRPSRLDAGE